MATHSAGGARGGQGLTWLSTSMAMSTNMSCSSRMLVSSLMISLCRVSISFSACFVIWESILIWGVGGLYQQSPTSRPGGGGGGRLRDAASSGGTTEVRLHITL